MLGNTQPMATKGRTTTARKTVNTRNQKHWQEVEEISLAALSAGDHIEISTANSLYIFTITDAKQHFGHLMGGIFTKRPELAMLVGIECPESASKACDAERLTVNSRALFLTGTSQHPGRLLTSEILGLRIAKAVGRRSAN